MLCMYVCIFVYMYICLYVYLLVCMSEEFVCMNGMYVCMNVCMYVCLYFFINLSTIYICYNKRNTFLSNTYQHYKIYIKNLTIPPFDNLWDDFNGQPGVLLCCYHLE